MNLTECVRNIGRLRLSVALATVVITLFNSGAGHAQSSCTLTGPTTWSIGSSGSWTVDTNWTPATFPNSSGTNVCIVDGVSTVTLSASVSTASLQLASGNDVDITTDNQLSVFGPQIINAGTIQVTSGGGAFATLNMADNVTLSGGGTVTMSNASGNGAAIVQGNNATLTNVDNTIQGFGVIGNGSLAVVNGNTITANTTGGTLTLNGGGGITNANGTTAGLLEATNGGTLDIATSVKNAGGNITANGGTVLVDAATVQGGTLNTLNGGTMATASGSATLDGSTTAGAVTISSGSTYTASNNATTNLLGTITNQGTIQLTSGGGAFATLNMAGNVTLNGGGTLTMSNASGNGAAIVQGNNATLTNVDNTIQGFGVIGNGSLAVVNGNTITANTTGGTLTLNGSGGITNADGGTGGLLEATGGGTLVIDGLTVNNASGNITADGGTVQVGGVNAATIEGGTLNTLHGGTLATGGQGATLDGSTTAGAVMISSGSTYTASNNVTANLLGTITNQGTIQLTSGGGAFATLNMAGSVTLSGGGTVTMNNASGNGAAVVQGNNATLTNVNNTVQGFGTIGAGSLALVNGGTITANTMGGTLTLNGSGGLTNNGTFAASNDGTLTTTVPFTNTGLVHAISGTINADAGFTGTTGTAQIDAPGTLTIGANSTVGTLIHNGSGAASLNLGANNITVSSDYTNGNFGTGNSFNKLANVATTGGQILAAGPNPANLQVITGADVTGGNTATPTLALGNVHVGDSTTYQIANQGTAANPSLRGAIQTDVNGGNITGGLLTGSGVTAANFGPLAPGFSTGDLTVTAAAPGSLSGQAMHIANNFGNVPEQTISITGAAYLYAALGLLQQGGQGSLSGNASSGYVLDFGNVQQNSSQEALLAILNNNPLADQAFTDLLSTDGNGSMGPFDLAGCAVKDLPGGVSQGGCDGLFDTSTLGNFTDSFVFPVESSNPSFDQVIGSVTLTVEGDVVGMSPVPAPLIGRGLPVLLAVGGVLFGAKLSERRKRRRSLGSAVPRAAA